MAQMKHELISVNTTWVMGNAGQYLVTVFEANLDPGQVKVQRNEYAIRSIFPLQFLIEGLTVNLFYDCVLKPLVAQALEKFAWKRNVDEHRNSNIPFSIIVNLREDNLILELEYEMNQEVIKNIWDYQKQTLDKLSQADLIRKITKVRFDSEPTGKCLAICYENTRPSYVLDLETEQFISVQNSDMEKYREPSYEEKEEIKLKRYQENLTRLENLKK